MILEELKNKVRIPDPWFDKWLEVNDWTVDQLARNEFPAQIPSLQSYQLTGICYFPDLFAYSFLKDPDYPDDPWVLWDYQKESFLHKGNVIHQCAAEVGKTREIIAYVIHKAFTVPNGSGLLAAPQLIHLMEIIDAIEWQFSENPIFKGSLVLHRKFPHHKMVFANGFKIDFRPTGHDGTSLRGVHVKTFAIMEEAAKAHNRKIWNEFWRAVKPGCEKRIYSTPDGRRDTVYYKLTQLAAGKKLDKADLKSKAIKKAGHFRLFKWSKTLMPPPFWTADRKQGYIEEYGGEDSPGYRHNVLGEHGDPENAVFPWDQFKKLITPVDFYRSIKIVVNNDSETVSVKSCGYLSNKETVFFEEEYSSSEFKLSSVLIKVLEPLSGVLIASGDFGHSPDPTEILIKQVIGKVHKLVLRVNMKGVTYDQQAICMDTLDTVYSTDDLALNWGMDVGNAGSAVMHFLQSDSEKSPYKDKDYKEKIKGYQFAHAYDAFDEDGETIIDEQTEKPVRKNAKEIATDLLVTKMQRGELIYPPDPDIINDYPGHTYREGTKGRIYNKENDHLIDSDRAMILAQVMSQDDWDFFQVAPK